MSVKFTTAGSLKKGSYVLIDGEPCRVTNVSVSKPGKHGSSKARIEGVGIVDGKKRTLISPGTDDVEVPIIEKRNAQVLSHTDKIANVMDTETYETFDLEIPEELQGQIMDGSIVVYWKVMNYLLLKQIKE